jgi:hypothetical protein
MTRTVIAMAALSAALAVFAPAAQTFDSANEKMHGLVPVKDVYGKTKTAGLGWHFYPEKNGCRLVKPPVICTDRNEDLVPDPSKLRSNRRLNARMVDCGLVLPTGGGSLKRTLHEWASATFVFADSSGKETRVTASRLSPAALVRTDGAGVQVFAGAGPSVFATASGSPLAAADLAKLARADLSAGWLLAWFGRDGATPAAGPDPAVNTMWDVPILIVFSESVRGIQAVPGRGLGFEFGSPGGTLAIMPLLGDAPILAAPAKRQSGGLMRDFLTVKLPPTATWDQGVPPAVLDLCKAWFRRLGQFPMSVRETTTYDPATDSVKTATSFAFQPVRRDGVKLAPVPPSLGLAMWGGFPAELSPKATDTGLVTSWGPLLGVEGADAYTCTCKGLGRYVNEYRRFGPADKVPPALRDLLNREVDKATEAGIMAPWLLMGQISVAGTIAGLDKESGRLINGIPAENIHFITELIPAVDAGRQARLRKLLADWQKKYPCLKVVHQPADQDARREVAPVPVDLFRRYNVPNEGQNFHLKYGLVPVEAVYAWEAYCRALGAKPDRVPTAVIDPYLRRQDWSTGSSFRWDAHARVRMDHFTYRDRDYGWSGVADANRLFAALVGMIRLAQAAGDSAQEVRGWHYLARTAATRLAMEKYRYWLYDSKLVGPPADPKWLRAGSASADRYTCGLGLHTFHRNGPGDDPLSVFGYDEFGAWAAEEPERIHFWTTGRLPGYVSMVPELGRFLHHHATREVADFCRVVAESVPDWYTIRPDNPCVHESYCMYPEEAHEFFLARAWIVQQKPQELERYADLAWLARGDWFYMHKLAETANAYRGLTWRGGP